MRNYILIWFLILPLGLVGQSQASIGILPEVNVSYRWADKWRFTGQIESMQRSWNKPAAEGLIWDYEYVRTDFTSALSYKLNPEWTLGTGYMLRFQDGEVVHRFIQQVSSASKKGSVRIGHRLRTDETFTALESPEWRFRYRFSIEVPLNGLSINDREWYALASAEALGRVQQSDFSYEQRAVFSLGYNINSANKIETGFDYRLDRFLDSAPRHRLWYTVSYFLNL